MESPNTTVFDDTALGQLVRLFTDVNGMVRTMNFSAAVDQKWKVAPDQFSGKLPQFLHRVFSRPRNDLAAKFAIGILQIVSLMLVNNRPDFLLAPGPLILKLIPMLFISAVIVCTTLGAYWSFIELSMNTQLPNGFRMLSLGLIFIVQIAAFFLLIYAWRSTPLSGAPPIHQPIVDARKESLDYWALLILVVYVSAAGYGMYFMLRLLSNLLTSVWALLKLSLKYHALESADLIRQLLCLEVDVFGEGEPTKIQDLGTPYIDALQEWTMLRRQVVQSKLIPTTLLLALLGVLANTPAGEWAVTVVIALVSSVVEPASDSDYLLDLVLLLLLLGLFTIPTRAILNLLSEAHSMDVVAQACVLARSTKVIEQDNSSRQAEQAGPPASIQPRWLTWLRRWRIV